MRVSPTVTELLAAWRGGDERARDTLIEAVYAELHRLAEIYLRRERHNHTLQPTALINEAYLKLIDQGTEIHFENRAHFVNVAALFMRRILVDYARARKSDKRGGSRQFRLSITSADKFVKESEVDLIDLDEALKRLAEIDEQKSRIVELRFFGGLTIEETAAALNISETTVERGWRMSRAWLRRELGKDEA